MDKVTLGRLLAANAGRFYVYLLLRPDKTPFYVGKGFGSRVFVHESEARDTTRKSHKLNTIRLIKRLGQDIGYSIIEFFDDESACLGAEVKAIRRIGRYDLGEGPLTNLTNGGEGTIGLSAETRARIDHELHSEDAPGDRGIANRFFKELCNSVRSVPIRPLGEIARPRPLHAVPLADRMPTMRQAAALAASAIANRVMIERGAAVPRRMVRLDAPMIIEFGACEDVLRSGMATLPAECLPAYETLVLTEKGCAAICRHLDLSMLVSAGVVMPPLSSINTPEQMT